MLNVRLNTLMDRVGTLIYDIHTHIDGISHTALRTGNLCILVTDRSIMQSVTERIEHILVRITICAIGHIIIRKLRKIFRSLIKGDRQLSGW